MNKVKNNVFSLKIYLLTVTLLSWPFQIAYGFLGESYRPLLLISMIMVAVATFICGKYIFSDGFKNAGWTWGKPMHFLLAFVLALFLWLVPVLIEQFFHLGKAQKFNTLSVLTTFLFSFTITLIPAFSEEFGWRGYLLPRMMARYTTRKALLIHGFITWFWHLPVIVIMGVNMGGNLIVTISAIVVISLIPTIMHAIVFAAFWSTSNSLAVSTVYHSAFDETRDTLQNAVGLGPLAEIWQMLILTMLGMTLLWRTKWLER